MTSEERAALQEGLGAIEDELRQRRAVDNEIIKRLDVLIKLAGGNDAKTQALREDHDALSAQVQDHERRLRPAIAR